MPNSSTLGIRKIGSFSPFPLEIVKNKVILPFFWQIRPFWPFKSNPRGHEKWTLAPIFLPSIRLSRCTSEMSNSGHSMSAKRNRKLFLLLRHHQWLIGHQYFFCTDLFADSPEGTKSTVVYLQCVYRILLGVK